jgi:topoisomerase-4 subunit A
MNFSASGHLHTLLDKNFLEYASYVIKERAIPELLDGLKPVQRRILHSLWEMDDGKLHKVANVIGHTMRYHPHGDASIGDALVVLANKEYFIDKQGNYGNILTGDPSSAPRYIECRLTDLARDTLFNPEITNFADSYDGRNREPLCFPCKIPYVLLQGAEGIAVGMATKILPHNFCETLNAQIAYLEEKKFKLFPDFYQGGIMDVSEYQDGVGKIRARAKIRVKNHKTLVVHELPFGVTSEQLIASVEDAIRKNKIKVTSIHDYTAENIEIEMITQKGVDAEEILPRLYAHTDCEVSISSNMTLIADSTPKIFTVTEVLKLCTENVLEILKAELKIKIQHLKDKLHQRSLEQIFIEKKLYRHLETSDSYEEAKTLILKGIQTYVKAWNREVTEEDLEKLLEIPIKKISKYDMEKNRSEIEELHQKIKVEEGHLLQIKRYTISFLKNLLKKYGDRYPRKTKIEGFEEVSVRDFKDKDTKVFFDKKTGYIGTKVKGDVRLDCSSFDKILLIQKNGNFIVLPPPEKLFCDKLAFFGIADKEQVFNLLSRDKKNKACYVKRFKIGGFIQNKEYDFLDEDHKLEAFTSRTNMGFEIEFESLIQGKLATEKFNFDDFPVRGPSNRGTRISTRGIFKMEIKSPNLVEKGPAAELSSVS